MSVAKVPHRSGAISGTGHAGLADDSPANKPLLEQLRACTGPRHRALDESLDLRRRSITRARYVQLLNGSLRVLVALEPALSRWGDAYDGDIRVPRLRDDLRVLGESPDAIGFEARLPVTPAEAFGAAYVVEGSALGGRVLAPFIAQALALPAAATSYLRLRGDATVAYWRRWLLRLDAFDAVAHPRERAAACAMACATFDDYARALAPVSTTAA